jgi:hypothetical protein
MVRLGVLFAALFIAGYFSFTSESEEISNSLVCLYSVPNVADLTTSYLENFKTGLPKRFPIGRFEFLVQDVRSAKLTAPAKSCQYQKHLKYQNSLLHNTRMSLHPLYPNAGRTLMWISVAQKNTARAIQALSKLKMDLIWENQRFESFSQDCERVKSFVDQIHLLESHLKISKERRKPAAAKRKEQTEQHMNRNISRQIGFARKHLSANEKLFKSKWKIYFEYDQEKRLCQY